MNPHKEFVAFVKSLETKCLEEFDSICHKIGIRDILFNERYYALFVLCCESCDSIIVKACFIRIRMYFLTKFFNKEIIVPNFKNKSLCFSHVLGFIFLF